MTKNLNNDNQVFYVLLGIKVLKWVSKGCKVMQEPQVKIKGYNVEDLNSYIDD